MTTSSLRSGCGHNLSTVANVSLQALLLACVKEGVCVRTESALPCQATASQMRVENAYASARHSLINLTTGMLGPVAGRRHPFKAVEQARCRLMGISTQGEGARPQFRFLCIANFASSDLFVQSCAARRWHKASSPIVQIMLDCSPFGGEYGRVWNGGAIVTVLTGNCIENRGLGFSSGFFVAQISGFCRA